MKNNGSPEGHGGFSAHVALVVCTLLFTINFMDRSVISAVLEPMKKDLGLSDASRTGADSFFISWHCCPHPSPTLSTGGAEKKSIGLMALLWSGFTYGTGIARSSPPCC